MKGKTRKHILYGLFAGTIVLFGAQYTMNVYAEENNDEEETTVVENVSTTQSEDGYNLEDNQNGLSQSNDETKELEEVKEKDITTTSNSASTVQKVKLNTIKTANVQQAQQVTDNTSVNYQVHVQNIGWQGSQTNGATAGTTNQSKRLEAIQIQLKNQGYTGNIEYRTHIQDYGWETGWKSNGQISGTTGQSKRLEAIQIRLSGDISNYYDIYYRVHAQDYGWLAWTKDGSISGTMGLSKRLEAIQIELIKKENTGPSISGVAYICPLIQYNTHVQNIGWQGNKTDGQIAGTTGQGLRIEALDIKLLNQEYSGNILYKAHIQDIGWDSNWKSNGQVSGTTGQKKRVEAVVIALTGDISNHYDVYYRTHSATYGWFDWTKDGMISGTVGMSKAIEAIQIQLVEKGAAAPTSENSVTYIGYNSGFQYDTALTGWQKINGDYYYFNPNHTILKNTEMTYVNQIGYLNGNGKFIVTATIASGNAATGTTNGTIYMTGIDISEHNGDIDLTNYKNQFVIIRIGYDTVLDKKALRNMNLCDQLGIPYGIYLYSYALNTNDAAAEANFVLNAIQGRNVRVGVWYDMEDADNYKSKRNALNGTLMTNMCNTFCSIIQSKGYYTGVYSSSSWFTYYLPGVTKYAKWVANWGTNDGQLHTRYNNWGPLQQYTSYGNLDRNVMYVPLSTFTR